MPLKKVNMFSTFDWIGFAKDKKLMCTACDEYKDYNTNKHLGTLVEAAIIEDNTDYRDEDGNKLNISNRFEKLKFKVKKDIDVPLNAIINPINVTGKVTGEYRNNLSLKCDDIQVITQQPRKV